MTVPVPEVLSIWKRVSDLRTKRMIAAGSAPVVRSGMTKGNIMFTSVIRTPGPKSSLVASRAISTKTTPGTTMEPKTTWCLTTSGTQAVEA